jgi:serine acetyltransferase/glycosyltransferase involved in cell wall biosynthesis
MFDHFQADLARYAAMFSNRSILFTLLTKQGLWALAEYRFSHWVRYQVHIPVVRPLLQAIGFVWHKLIEILTGIDLPSRAQIGKGLYIPHFGEIIIHCDTKIGDYCTLSQGVTIGLAGRGQNSGVPTIGDRVYIAPGAKIAGAITVGDDVAIGANAVVVKSLPAHAVAVGVPAKVISYEGSRDFIAYPSAYPPDHHTDTDGHIMANRQTIPMRQPLVSILINNYNYAGYLREAIDSALNQTYDQVEVIVVDDGSTDDSRSIIASYGDRIQAIYQPNQGQAAAFNAGFAHSQGEIICFLDADDVFYPDKAAVMAEIFQAHPEIGWCFHPLRLIQDGQMMLADAATTTTIRSAARSDLITIHDLTARMQRGKLADPLAFPIPATSAMSFSRSLLQQIMPMPVGPGISLNDSYIKFVALGLGPGAALNQAIAVQRIHQNNAFTLKSDPRQLAKIHLLLSYWMRHNFPHLTQFTNNLFATGVILYQQVGTIDADDQLLIKRYTDRLPWFHRMLVTARILFYRFQAAGASR